MFASGDVVGFVLSLAAAMAMGWAIGWERHAARKPVGSRTYAILAGSMAAATYVGLSLGGDPGKALAGVMGAAGFLGAGVIIKSEEKVLGTTTAASVLATAVIGGVCGVGMIVHAAIFTAATLGVLRLKRR